MMQTEKNKIALVTGANKGIGFEIAKALAGNGYHVYIGSRDLQNGKAAAEKIGGKSQAIQLDITDENSIKESVRQVQNTSGHIDLLVNNAAISQVKNTGLTMEEMLEAQKPSVVSITDMRVVWDTNVFGTLAVTQAFLPLLRKSEKARIVTVSSALGSLTLNSNPANPYRSSFGAVYGASKTALNGVMLSLAIELERENIKVNLVSPGFAATALNNFQGTDTVEVGSLEPIRVALAEDIPTGSFTGPNNILGTDTNDIPW
ncbi:SDR family NAD(P)-dependent oxidoreductase [Sinomicrobium sp. M5D2P17]